MTNWEKLFGTPERVAITFAAIDYWQENAIRLSGPPENGEWYAPGMCYLLGETVCANFSSNPIELLEWLESEVRDD